MIYQLTQTKYNWQVVALIVLSIPVIMATVFLPPAVDWTLVYRPACTELLHLRNPYHIKGFMNPPWALIPLIPLSILPMQVSRGVLIVISFVSLALVARKLRLSHIITVLWLLSPPVLASLYAGNLEWLVFLGLLLPRRMGILLLVLKPQVGIGVIVLWMIEAWCKDRWKGLMQLLWPTIFAFVVSFVAFGPWPLYCTRPTEAYHMGRSFFPLSLVVGLPLLALAIWKRDVRYALSSGPYLAPYAMLHSWAGVLLSIQSPVTMLVSVIAMWIEGVL